MGIELTEPRERSIWSAVRFKNIPTPRITIEITVRLFWMREKRHSCGSIKICEALSNRSFSERAWTEGHSMEDATFPPRSIHKEGEAIMNDDRK
jgi:hypothetical protein